MTKHKRLTSAARVLLEEAQRRYCMRPGNRLGGELLFEAWTGLGYRSYYKPALDAGLMEWIHGEAPPPRCMGWLRLTVAGAVIVQGWLDEENDEAV